MTTNKEMAAALRVLADRIEGCERELDFRVSMAVHHIQSLEGLRLACSVGDGQPEADSYKGCHWVRDKIAGCIALVCHYRTGLLSKRVKKHRVVESEVGADVSLIRGA